MKYHDCDHGCTTGTGADVRTMTADTGVRVSGRRRSPFYEIHTIHAFIKQ